MNGQRVRAKDIKKTLIHGVYVAKGVAYEEEHVLRALQQHYPNSWASHFSAAKFHRLAFPLHPVSGAVHLTTPVAFGKIRRKGIVSYQSSLDPDLHTWRGLRFTSPEHTVLDMSRYANVDDLVVMIDQLVREPRPELEDSWEPIYSLQKWQALTKGWTGRGIQKIRAATKLARVGSDSPPETRLRLAIVRAGLPEPTLQIELPIGGWPRPSADLGYEDLKIAVHYDGSTHRSREQQGIDNWRDNSFQSQGWRNLKCSATDLSNGFRATIHQLRLLIKEREREIRS